jgi:hypothetical protein
MDAVGSMFDIAHLSANKEPRISVYKIGQTPGPLRWNIDDSHGASRRFLIMICSQCRSVRVHQSRREGMIEKRLLALFFVRPFRCEECDHRFFRWSFGARNRSSPTAS